MYGYAVATRNAFYLLLKLLFCKHSGDCYFMVGYLFFELRDELRGACQFEFLDTIFSSVDTKFGVCAIWPQRWKRTSIPDFKVTSSQSPISTIVIIIFFISRILRLDLLGVSKSHTVLSKDASGGP